MQNLDDFQSGQLLPTFNSSTQLSVLAEEMNGRKRVIIQSPGSAGTIVTPPNYACNVSLVLAHLRLLDSFLCTCQIVQWHCIYVHVEPEEPADAMGFCLQLVIYGINGDLVPNENLQNPDTDGAIHNITHYLITYLVPGGPSVPIFTIIAAVNERNETAEVASTFNAAVVAGYISELIALLKQVSCPVSGITDLCRRCCCSAEAQQKQQSI